MPLIPAKNIIAEQVAGYAKAAVAKEIMDIASGLKEGKPIQDLIPAEILGFQDQKEKKADARNRAARTFLQSFAIDVAITLLTVIGTALVSLDVTSKEAWVGLGVLLAKTLISAPVSYFMRMLSTPKTPSLPMGSVVSIPVPTVGPEQVYTETPPSGYQGRG